MPASPCSTLSQPPPGWMFGRRGQRSEGFGKEGNRRGAIERPFAQREFLSTTSLSGLSGGLSEAGDLAVTVLGKKVAGFLLLSSFQIGGYKSVPPVLG